MNPKTPVQFKTNIDCCKKFMPRISGLALEAINPLVGDQVLVYRDSAIEVWLTVIGRSWRLLNGASPVLEVELHCASYQTIQGIEKLLRS